MILDYRNNKEFALANGIKLENNIGEIWFNTDKMCKDITFRNLHHLCVEGVFFENCSFENCHQLTVDECQMKGCTFKNVDEIEGVRTDFDDCSFKNCCCSDGPFLVIDSNGHAKNCTFDTITVLGDQGYVIYSVYGEKSDVKKITGCKFVDCKVENEDGKLCYCAYFKPFSSHKTIKTDNLDYETCDIDSMGI